MIIDKFEHIKDYSPMLPALDKVAAFIEEYNKAPKEVGKYEIDSDRLFASVQSYTSKAYENSKTEAHKSYIDVQYVISGSEEMYMADTDELEQIEECYSKGKDVAFYDGTLTTKTVLNAGCFAILFPNDAHRPGVLHNEAMPITKIVFKVKI